MASSGVVDPLHPFGPGGDAIDNQVEKLKGFKLDKIKSNLVLGNDKAFYDPTVFFKDYVEKYVNSDQPAPGLDIGTTRSVFNSLQKGRPISNETYKALENGVRNTLASGDWFSAPFNELRIQESKKIGGVGITDAHVNEAASQIADKISADFQTRFGRSASQPEVAAIFNRLSPSSTILTNPDKAVKLLTSQEYESTLKDFESKLPSIDAAQLNLKNIGKSLGQDDIDKILAPGMTPERADVTLADLVTNLREANAQEVQKGVEGKQNIAIDKLQGDLESHNSKVFQDDITPQIVAALRNRGLVPGPELTNVLSEEAGRMARDRESVIAPLKAQVALQAPEQAFQFALSGANEAGRRMSSATDFLRNINVLDRTNAFTAGESALNRDYSSKIAAQNMAVQLALMGRQPQGPTALDYFLQTLPVAGQIASAGIKAKWGGGQ